MVRPASKTAKKVQSAPVAASKATKKAVVAPTPVSAAADDDDEDEDEDDDDFEDLPSDEDPELEGIPTDEEMSDDEELDEDSEHHEESSEGEGEDESEDEDEESGGVSEEGMKKLIALLGEDGLDEFALAQLEGVDDEEEEDEDEDMEADEAASDSKVLNLEPEEEDEDIDEDAIALDDLGSDISVDEDAVPRRKITINNRAALKVLKDRLMVSNAPWADTLTLVSKEGLGDIDPSDDLKREVAFYKQALSIVNMAKKLCVKHDVPFTRPRDYYAEMVKSDSHMERVRSKLVEESSGIKKSEAAKRQRELKKYGKQIQHEKLKSRVQEKKSFDERVKGIKRKRAGGAEIGDEKDGGAFDVRLDNAMEGRGGAASRGRGDKPKMPRHARDNKFGMGGGGRRSKQNDRESTNDFGGAKRGESGGRGGRGGKAQRPGKSRRKGGK